MQRLLKDERGIAMILVVVLSVLGVVVVGAVVAGAVILSNDVSITVTNQSCGTWDIAEGSAAAGFNFLPGINVPEQVAQGETVIVQLPKMFVDSVIIEYGSVEVTAFGRTFTLGTSAIDMQRSTWDGTPLAALVGSEIEISGEHTLVMECQ
jgi:Flp pilus assembly pilin Flp